MHSLANVLVIILELTLFAFTYMYGAGGLLRGRLLTSGDSPDTSWSKLVSWLRSRPGTCIQRICKLFLPSRYVPVIWHAWSCSVSCSEKIVRTSLRGPRHVCVLSLTHYTRSAHVLSSVMKTKSVICVLMWTLTWQDSLDLLAGHAFLAW